MDDIGQSLLGQSDIAEVRDVGPLEGFGEKERVISMNVLTIRGGYSSQTSAHAAFDVESEGLARDSGILPEPMTRRVQNLVALRVRVPGGPLCIDRIRESSARMSISLCANRSACSAWALFSTTKGLRLTHRFRSKSDLRSVQF